MFTYSISLIWSDIDECYVATIPEFPGLSAHGYEPLEAVEEAHLAAKLFIEDIIKSGGEVPAPARWAEYSGQFRVRLPKTLHSNLSKVAEREGVSLNTLIVSMLSAADMGHKVAEKICRHIDEKIDDIYIKSPVKQEIVYIKTGRDEAEEKTHQKIITLDASFDDNSCEILH